MIRKNILVVEKDEKTNRYKFIKQSVEASTQEEALQQENLIRCTYPDTFKFAAVYIRIISYNSFELRHVEGASYVFNNLDPIEMLNTLTSNPSKNRFVTKAMLRALKVELKVLNTYKGSLGAEALTIKKAKLEIAIEELKEYLA